MSLLRYALYRWCLPYRRYVLAQRLAAVAKVS